MKKIGLIEEDYVGRENIPFKISNDKCHILSSNLNLYLIGKGNI